MPRSTTVTARSPLSTLRAHLAGLQAQHHSLTNHPIARINMSEEQVQRTLLTLAQRITEAEAWVTTKALDVDSTNARNHLEPRPNNLSTYNNARARSKFPHTEMSALRADLVMMLDQARHEAKQIFLDRVLITDSSHFASLRTRLQQRVDRTFLALELHALDNAIGPEDGLEQEMSAVMDQGDSITSRHTGVEDND